VRQPAWDVRCLIQRLYEGYFAYIAARDAAKKTYEALPPRDVWIPEEIAVSRNDGTGYRFNRAFYLREAYEVPQTVNEMERAWFVGALMTAADALEFYKYFDRSPTLELIYHLRNGVGHGNHFDFSNGKTRLAKYPAHNHESFGRGAIDFDITLSLQGRPVLFEFMGPGDVCDVLQGAAVHLAHIATGRVSANPRPSK